MKMVKRILMKVKKAMNSKSTSLTIHETAKMNLHHLAEHSCPSKYIQALGMVDLVRELVHYPDPHVVKLALYLLKRPEWGGKVAAEGYSSKGATSMNSKPNIDRSCKVRCGKSEAPHAHSEQGSFDGSEFNGSDPVPSRAHPDGYGTKECGADDPTSLNDKEWDSVSRHDGPTIKKE